MADLPTKIGPYLIDRELGRGGMGVVYLGRDPRLERAVAVKGIAADLASDPIQVSRLQREARVLAQLSHPNIVTIFGIEEDEGKRFLVMEYVEGPDLADRLAAGALSMRDALSICLQVARAVEAAHAAGVIHRDLKPGNVKVGPTGRVRVLDFGLARGVKTISNPDAATALVGAHTTPGSILGTPGYMSPEQARSQELDKRTDMFSFGCVLYECLTGKRAFWGKTVADVIAATLTAEPEWGRLPPDGPPALWDVLTACLQKDVENRLGSIGVAADVIEELLSSQRVMAALPSAMMETRGMPRPQTSLVGRTASVGAVLSMLKRSRLVTMIAPSGVGKTRLALRLAGDLQSRGAAFTAYVDLAGVSDAPGMARAVAAAVGGQRATASLSLSGVLSGLDDVLVGKTKDQVLFLDDWERMGQSGVAGVAEAIDFHERSRFVLTGREPTGLPGEEVFRVPSLEVPPEPMPASEAELKSFDAFRLFLDRVQDLEPPFELTLPRRAEVGKIVRRLGGVPLAIELAAARVSLLAPERILRGIEDALREIAAESGGALQRASIVRAAVKWSFQLLSPREQVFLARISGLIGGFSVEDALRIVAQDTPRGDAGQALLQLTLRDAAGVLDGLVAKALVCHDAGAYGEPCFGVHQAVRTFAIKQAAGFAS